MRSRERQAEAEAGILKGSRDPSKGQGDTCSEDRNETGKQNSEITIRSKSGKIKCSHL